MPEKLRRGEQGPVLKNREEIREEGDLQLPDHAEGGSEIEIKFIVEGLPKELVELIRARSVDCAVISQGYVNAVRKESDSGEETSAERKETIRFREMWRPAKSSADVRAPFRGSVKHRLTSKGPVNREAAQQGIIHRAEQELGDQEGEPARRKAFHENWEKTRGHRVRKVRFSIPMQFTPDFGGLLELDVFLGHLKGLVIAEIEFLDREMAQAFLESPERPKWLRNQIKDIDRYGNAQLARKRLPKEIGTFKLQRKIDKLVAKLKLERILDERNKDMKAGLLIDEREF